MSNMKGVKSVRGNGSAHLDVDDDPFDGGLSDTSPRCIEFQGLIRREIELLGENVERQGLKKTPLRVAKAMTWLTRGYEMDVVEVVGDAVFEEDRDRLV